MIRTVDEELAAGKVGRSSTEPPVDPLRLTRQLLRLLIALNLCMGVGILALLCASLVAATWVMRALGMHPATTHSTLPIAMRMVMIVGIASIPLTHVVLTNLRDVVETVGHGGAFIAENARRLRSVAWAVLGLEVLHLAVGLTVYGIPSRGEALDLGWSFSITRWLCVLLLFVLARVFEQGVLMREDVEGTV